MLELEHETDVVEYYFEIQCVTQVLILNEGSFDLEMTFTVCRVIRHISI
jgi:hypothetical protein